MKLHGGKQKKPLKIKVVSINGVSYKVIDGFVIYDKDVKGNLI